MTSKLKTHFKQFMIGSLIAALGAGTYVIAAVTFSDFTAGTAISASDMNTKLNALKDAVNANTVASVAGVAFIQQNDDDTSLNGGCKLNRSTLSSYAHYTGGNNCDAFAPITFPQGALLTRLSCTVVDNSANNGVALIGRLYRMNLETGADDIVFTTAASTDSANVQIVTDVSAVNNLVDNNTYAYFLSTDWGTTDLSGVGANLRLYGCSVQYV